jgi:hypothetical protein
MFGLRTKPRPDASAGNRTRGQAKRDRENARGRRLSEAVRDIGDCLPPLNPARREACKYDYRRFCETYFPEIFYLPWSTDHLKAIAKIERAVLHGGLFALAMPRGAGKTTLAQIAVVWALLYGHRQFVCLIAVTDAKAQSILANVKAVLNTNKLLAEDFDEVCKPIRAIENDARRCAGQLCNKHKTNIVWHTQKVVLPTVAGAVASGSIVTACGLTSSIRGQNHTLPGGTIIRPSLVIVDDPQDRESANSESQCQQRVATLSGDVLGLAGPGEKIAGVMPCTVIRSGDMADQILDRQQHPDWQGERCKMIYSFPSNTAMWERYTKLRVESLQTDGVGQEATDFYAEHQAEMDLGAVVAWPQRFNKDEISALQNAMNLKLRDEAAFWAEYQNEPKVSRAEAPMLKAEHVVRKLNGLGRGTLPLDVQHITAFADVHDALIYYAVVGWTHDSFSGFIADYGAWPDQGRRYFTKREAERTLQRVAPGAGKEGAITLGLQSLTADLFTREWRREDQTTLPISRLLIDVGYVPDTVYGFIRASAYRSSLMGSRGIGIGAAHKPMSEYRRLPGEQLGYNWMIPRPAGRELQHVKFDANFWKTFIHERFGLPLGEKGTLTLWGNDGQEHRLIGDHVTGEYGTATEGRGRKVIEWRQRPNRPDNHLLDCLAGCAVGASMCGCGGRGGATGTRAWKRKRPRVSYMEE